MTIRTSRHARRPLTVVLAALLALLVVAGPAAAADPTPSTNATNQTRGWAHFRITDLRPGEVDVELVSTRRFISCFEMRSDGAPSPYPGMANQNVDITDGVWPWHCANNNVTTFTLTARQHVEIRMVFGGERNERFTWTRIDVRPDPRVMLADLVAAGGITPSLAAKISHALDMAEAWLALPGRLGPALSHYDRAVHLLRWQVDVIERGKPNQGDPAGLLALAQAIQDLADSYRT